jgi:hypothetical protein
MSFDEIKRRQLMRTEIGKRVIIDEAMAFARETNTFTPAEQLSEGNEGKKKHHTPKFVQHCVAAITGEPESLERIEKNAPKGSDGSPFAICWAKYKSNRRSLAAKHAKGKHHTVKDYEKSLATLRQEAEKIRASRPSRRQIVFEHANVEPKGARRVLIEFRPE